MKFLSFLCCFAVILSCFSLTAYGYSGDTIKESVSVVYSGLSEIREINVHNMNIIRKNTFVSDEKKTKIIFESVGIDNTEYLDNFDCLVGDLDNIMSIVSNISYYEINQDGNVRVISKDECLRKAKEVNEANETSCIETMTLSNGSVSGETESENGYMIIATSAFYKSNEAEGTYNFISTYEWLTEPATRSKDAISLASGDSVFTWSSNRNNYSATFLCNCRTMVDGNSATILCEEVNSNPQFCDTGFYFDFDLPKDGIVVANENTSSVRYTDMFFIMTGKARVQDYDDKTQMLWVNSKYAHIQIKSLAAVTFSWTYGQFPGVSIEKGSLSEKYYNNYLAWDYADHH